MKKRAALFLAIFAAIPPAWALTGAEIEEQERVHQQTHAASVPPRDVLTAILQHDFDADGDFRVRWTHFTDGKGDLVGDPCCRAPREGFTATEDDTVIVSSWVIVSEGKATRENASFVVQYHVVGDGAHVEGRSAVLEVAQPVHDETVAYRLRVIKGFWYLLDPPTPRVGVEGLKKVIERDLARTQESLDGCPAFVAQHPKTIHDPPFCDGHRRAIFEDQLQLRDLGPILEAAGKN